MTALSDLIQATLEQRGLSGESLRALSERSDGRLSKDAVRLYRGGQHGTPSEDVLHAWAELLDLPVERLRAAAGVPAGQQQPYRPPAEADRMSPRQRAAVDELIRSIVTGGRSEQEPQQGQGTTPIGSARSSRGRRSGAPTKHSRDSALSDPPGRSDLQPAASPERAGERRGIDVEFEDGV